MNAGAQRFRPQCPRCTSADGVEREGTGWFCEVCNLVFTGSPAEWRAERERQQRAEALETSVSGPAEESPVVGLRRVLDDRGR